VSNISSNDRIDDVTPGDIVAVDRGTGEAQPYKVVFKVSTPERAAYLVTFEDDDGETFQLEYAAGTRVTRALEAKWESGQSPTPHKPPTT
jgi:RecB family exonuclease